MVTTKELIEDNNIKRELLSTENEQYYLDLLMYIRLQLSLSERATEEVLMEMLDHLLEGQVEGKNAEEIFGSDPKAYADELIRQLPKEKKRDLFQFGVQVATNMFGWILLTRGILILIISQFKEIDNHIYLYSSLVLFGSVLIVGVIGVWGIFGMISKTAFKEKKTHWRNDIIVGLGGAILAGGVMVVAYFYREQGPSMPFAWYWSLVAGGVLWITSRVIKDKIGSK